MTDQERMKVVIQRTLSQLDMTRISNGHRDAMIDAGAVLEGARRYLIKHYGRRSTYALFARISDEIITPELAEGR